MPDLAAMKMEYRVVWKRVGIRAKSKRFATLRAAERRALMLGPEPWLAQKRDPDSLNCCNGYECGCGGVTVRQYWEGLEIPKLEYIRIDHRPFHAWTALEKQNGK